MTRKKIKKNITWTECSVKWSELYTCKECEDEVNRKGHLMKLQEAVHVDNLMLNILLLKSEQNIIPTILTNTVAYLNQKMVLGLN